MKKRTMGSRVQKRNFNKKSLMAILMLGLGIFLSLFSHWEMTSETWGSWLFARIFKETGRFVIFDRSPLYILYLNIFSWMGYPFSVTVEYLVSTCIVVVALVLLFRRYLGLPLASFSAFLWIPFLTTIEPPVQKLALACSCLAMVARRLKDKRAGFMISYALLIFAYMFRSTYVIFILVFAAWDISSILRKRGAKALLSCFIPQRRDWPIFAVLGLLVYFFIMQSAHYWNNAFFSTTTWFPTKGKTLTEGALIQHYNWQYIRDRYASFEGRDFYFTNNELFGDAKSVPDAILANSGFVAGQISKNIKSIIPLAVDTTMLHKIYSYVNHFLRIPVGWFCFFSLLAIFFGAFRSLKDDFMVPFVICSIAVTGSCVLIIPKERYMLSLIPVFILSAYWYGEKLSNLLKRNYKRWILGLNATLLFFLLLFSNGITTWLGLLRNIDWDIRNGELRVLEERGYSMKSSYGLIRPLIKNCKGVMALEHTFIGAFTNLPLSRIYDVWEIPPFGRLGDSVYNGLFPERIDCLIVSSYLATGIGLATNFQIRYQDYIRPYAHRLSALGAKSYKINRLGTAIILPVSDYGAKVK